MSWGDSGGWMERVSDEPTMAQRTLAYDVTGD